MHQKKFWVFIAVSVVTFLMAASFSWATGSKPGVGEKVVLRIWQPDITPGSDDEMVKEEIEKRLLEDRGINVDLQLRTVAGHDEYRATLPIKLASGEIDAMQLGLQPQQIEWLFDDTLTLPLNKLIDKYGQNLVRSQSKLAWQSITDETGQIKGIPYARVALSDIAWHWIRKDWLDQVGLSIPKTLPELEQALQAFKDNELGGPDTIPWAGATSSSWVADANFVESFLPRPENYLDADGNPNYIYSSGHNWQTEEGLKARLQFIHRLYEKGLLQQEYFTNDWGKVSELVMQGKTGYITDGWWVGPYMLEAARQDDPPQDWRMVIGFGREAGDEPRALLVPRTGRVTVILQAAKDKADEIIQYMDWEAESFDNFMLPFKGIKGVHWTETPDGNVTNDFEGSAYKEEGRGYSGIYSINRENPLYHTKAWFDYSSMVNPDFKPAFSEETPHVMVLDANFPYVFVKTAKYRNDMDMLLKEFMNKAVFEGFTEADYEAFKASWMKAGGTEYLEERNELFKKYYKP